MSSTPVRQPEVNAVGVVGPPCSSAAELPSPQVNKRRPFVLRALNDPLLFKAAGGDSAAAAMYIQQQQQQGMQQLQIRPPHMPQMMGPPQGGFQSPYDRNSSGSHFPLLRNASRAASIVEHRSVEREEDAVASA
ncbi:unnamed protein product [Toxocara canis]|uniref:Uncharacterized protein n=1 Tax=Toxocara canis TaxID=6265 RepID=A0A183V5L9_TOXCA|nr:unnamed protein product [Toxocara canis]